MFNITIYSPDFHWLILSKRETEKTKSAKLGWINQCIASKVTLTVGSSICHGKDSLAYVLEFKVFIGEAITID